MPKRSAAKPTATTIQENYERYFVPVIGRPVAQDMLAAAALQPGEAVLDVGCGTGILTRLAVQHIVPDGIAAGLDIDPGMLAVARSVTPAELEIGWYEGSAEAMPFPEESFDVVLCQMSLQFIPDRGSALREMRRVLVPHGRLVLGVPGPAGPLFATLANAVGRHIAPEARGFMDDVFSLNRAGEIEALLAEAGFQDIAALAETKEFQLPGPREFLWQYVNGTPLGPVVAAADQRAQQALEQEVVAEWSAFEESGGMDCQQPFLIARARK